MSDHVWPFHEPTEPDVYIDYDDHDTPYRGGDAPEGLRLPNVPEHNPEPAEG